ncbi:acetyl-CoA C-acetyltransferase [Salsuginibacillus kocurii]|uniref:acetyl-CoA C-acetyltransferase n=1 Tax=Salsuginibacillus kocurii TaxID=427078 RepID=UPI00035D48EC|nr:acetyl-CoA C-acetyltransferase [Salsuginibacillus kocurii]
MAKTLILAGARTPFAKFGGALATTPAPELGAAAIQGAMERSPVDTNDIEEVIMGHVLQAGGGQITSRQAAHAAGLPWEARTETINKVCASGMRSVTLADQLIRAKDVDVVVAGGMESMSRTPHALSGARWGERMGDGKLEDLMIKDGLQCSFTGVHMGVYGNQTAGELGISRDAQDAWAARSHQLAIAAMAKGYFKEEIVPVEQIDKKGNRILIERDEAPREDTTSEALAKLKPAFGKDGTITAGNAPGVNDGACAFVLASADKVEANGWERVATIEGQEALAVEAGDFPKTPGLVIERLLTKTGLSIEDIDRFEINEAFAAVALASQQIAHLDAEKINVNGGAVALGHPIGASGARIILTLVHELKRIGGGLGIAAICSGGGQGDAVLVRV